MDLRLRLLICESTAKKICHIILTSLELAQNVFRGAKATPLFLMRNEGNDPRSLIACRFVFFRHRTDLDRSIIKRFHPRRRRP